jgi:hypothetical protein
VPSTGVYVWSRSPQELLKKIPQLNELNGRWALAGTAAANLYAPMLTTFPDPSIWIESRFSSRQAATALGGEIVDKGAYLQILQSKNDLVLENASLWVPTNAAADLATHNLRIISRARAYIETINAAGRGPEVGQNLRQRIISNASPRLLVCRRGVEAPRLLGPAISARTFVLTAFELLESQRKPSIGTGWQP